MSDKLSASDIREFVCYLRCCTNQQVIGVYEKERDAGRDAYTSLAADEAHRRGIMDLSN